jgi:bifunctional aspartokinase / homoserine dehydrogenase 1
VLGVPDASTRGPCRSLRVRYNLAVPQPLLKVLKFGGSSVATPERIKTVGRIVLGQAKRHRVVLVVSAFGGVTNRLLESARLAESGGAGYERLYEEIAKRHHDAVEALLPRRARAEVQRGVDVLLTGLRDALHGTSLLRHAPPRALDVIGSFGERLSALIISAYLGRFNLAPFADAREFIVTNDRFTSAAVDFVATNRKTRAWYERLSRRTGKKAIPVVTGFIAATPDGVTTTIGRNGSDYTAAIVGAALDASVIEIWTDVDGVLSADPNAVKSAFVLPQVSYEEAMELSYFGAKVLHSATIAPAVAKGIPIHIKNTLKPQARGTVISSEPGNWSGIAKGITSVDDITLLTLRGLSMVGVPGTAERLFRALASARVNVILISQASSEHTICFAVARADATAAMDAVRGEFRLELQQKLTSLDEKPKQTIIAIVGEGMKGHPGVSGEVFGALGRHNINISAIAQGASERNISFVIDAANQPRALNVIHDAFFEKRKKLSLAVVGVGNIGTELLRQLEQQRSYLLSRGFDVRAVAIADSKRFIADAAGLDLSNWRSALESSSQRMSTSALARRLKGMELADAALVDCTASETVVDGYPEYIEADLHIITPNKRANVLPWTRYAALMELVRTRRKYFLCEANVGAGLPVISTLQDLVASGDTVIKVEGILSGTLSYLFNTFTPGASFSALVREAHGMGLTEPDPRADLSGEDVARKLLILGRLIGLKMNLSDITVESLVPRSLERGPFSDRFFAAYATQDAPLSQRVAAAQAKGAVLRYTGVLENGKAVAGLNTYPSNHPLASTQGADNVIVFSTKRYATTPLVIKGPGAGGEVTAMGVFSDILKLLHYLRA